MAALSALFFGTSPAGAADELIIERGPDRKPLFVETYRQTAYVLARHAFGLETYDLEVSSADRWKYRVTFEEVREKLVVSLHEKGEKLGTFKVAFPTETWKAHDEAEQALEVTWKLIGGKVRSQKTGKRPAAADMVAGLRALDEMDPLSIAIGLNDLGRLHTPAQITGGLLARMAEGYAWLGKATIGHPGRHARLLQARALAYSNMAGRYQRRHSPEHVLALALSGREREALLLGAKIADLSDETTALAAALAKRDHAATASRLQGESARRWRLAHALVQLRRGQKSDARRVLQRHLADNPADLFAASLLVDAQDAPGDGAVYQFYLIAAAGWEPVLELAGGQLPDEKDRRRLRSRPMEPASFAAGLARVPRDDGKEEVPGELRRAILEGFTLDAVFRNVDYHARRLGDDAAARRLLSTNAPLVPALKWGSLLDYALIEADRGTNLGLSRKLEASQTSPGTVWTVKRYLPQFDVSEWLSEVFPALDDTYDDRLLGVLYGSRETRPAALARMRVLAPGDPYAPALALLSGGTVLEWDRLLAENGDVPFLLRLAAHAERMRSPRDDARLEALIDRIIAADPEDISARLEKQALASARGDLDAASAALESAMALGPSRHDLAALRTIQSKIKHRQGDRKGAFAAALEASRSGEPDAVAWLAYLHEENGRYDLAEALYRPVLDKNGFDTELADDFALFLFRTGDPRVRRVASERLDALAMRESGFGRPLNDPEKMSAARANLLRGDVSEAYERMLQLRKEWTARNPEAALWFLSLARRLNKADKGVEILNRDAAALPRVHPLRPVYELIQGRRGLAAALKDLGPSPEVRSAAFYFIAEHLRATNDFEGATEFYAECVKEGHIHGLEHAMALAELKRVPSYPERLSRLWRARMRDTKAGKEVAPNGDDLRRG